MATLQDIAHSIKAEVDERIEKIKNGQTTGWEIKATCTVKELVNAVKIERGFFSLVVYVTDESIVIGHSFDRPIIPLCEPGSVDRAIAYLMSIYN